MLILWGGEREWKNGGVVGEQGTSLRWARQPSISHIVVGGLAVKKVEN